MKLITELREINSDFSISRVLDESTGDKRMYLQGPFAEGNVQNGNGRIYETKMLAEKVQNYHDKFISKQQAFGEFGHPPGPAINGERICIRILEMTQDRNQFVGKAQVSSTPMGRIVEGLINDGGRLGVSTRGMGSLKEQNGVHVVQPDYYLAAVDVVTNPSGPNCYVNGIMENVEWIYDERYGWRAMELAESHKKIVSKKYKELTEARKLQLFEQFLSKL